MAAHFPAMLTRRQFGKLSSGAAASYLLPQPSLPAVVPDITLKIAPYELDASPRHRFRTLAYNGQVPGPLVRMREGKPFTVEVQNLSTSPEIVHWHGLHLRSAIDGAMEEGTPMIQPSTSVRYTFEPNPPGFRWYHTHVFAGSDLTRGEFNGLHGFIMIDPADDLSGQAQYNRELFLALHDWGARMTPSADGSAMPMYDFSTINGRMLGFGEPIRVRRAERVLLHILNSSATDAHWLSLVGHSFRVIALDGNAVAQPQTVSMLRLAPAERISAIVEMNNPGIWILGEVRRHIQAAGMGIVLEYADATGKPQWIQPSDLQWSYRQFAARPQNSRDTNTETAAIPIRLIFDSKFQGHGNEEQWRINGKSYSHTDEPVLTAGARYRLVLDNRSGDDHPIHLHRHTFELRNVEGANDLRGIHKDVVLVPAKSVVEVEFTADNPGPTLLHCHQQDHMDRGFMMVFRYA